MHARTHAHAHAHAHSASVTLPRSYAHTHTHAHRWVKTSGVELTVDDPSMATQKQVLIKFE